MCNVDIQLTNLRRELDTPSILARLTILGGDAVGGIFMGLTTVIGSLRSEWSETHGFSLVHCGYYKAMGHHVCNLTMSKQLQRNVYLYE